MGTGMMRQRWGLVHLFQENRRRVLGDRNFIKVLSFQLLIPSKASSIILYKYNVYNHSTHLLSVPAVGAGPGMVCSGYGYSSHLSVRLHRVLHIGPGFVLGCTRVCSALPYATPRANGTIPPT
ncbi:hypothetical protein KI387_005807, partial [Taxus chinensis]